MKYYLLHFFCQVDNFCKKLEEQIKAQVITFG